MRIVLIGAGNVATHFGRKLMEVGEQVIQVFSRNRLKALQLAKELEAAATNDFAEINTDADLYILAVHDDAIGEIAAQLAENGITDKLIVHTSGATPMRVFEAASTLKRVGVFYPLQTFSKIRKPDFQKIPICIEARQEDDLTILLNLAHNLSNKVYHINDEQRASLHLAAVFVNNFTNHLFAIGEKIQTDSGLHFEMLLPLIHETVAKLTEGPPAVMQTGPAIRHDEATILRHLHLLSGQPTLQEIYQIMTKSIQQTL
ncbi:MAG: DUF2520 domain-containing protein [Bacteroidetes bacterium]|nr:DUF2520 domain-containing protein [Bacteroidota bacterium]